MRKFILFLITIFLVSQQAFSYECKSSSECAIMGAKFIEQKEYNTAIEYLNSAIEMDENEYFAYAYRAKANFCIKNYNQAEKDADKSLEIQPNSVAYGIKSYIYLLKGNYQNAIDNSTKAVELNPKYAKCYEIKAKAEYELKDYINALKDANKAINIDENLILCHQIRANSYAGLKDFPSAQQSCEKSAILFKNSNDRKNYNKMKKLAKYYKGKIK